MAIGLICPNCATKLEQLGTLRRDGRWVPDNLWRCSNCPPGWNRFSVDAGAVKAEYTLLREPEK